MTISQKLWCFFGVHEYERVYTRESVRRSTGDICGITYINRCKCCGSILIKVISCVKHSH